MSERPLEYQDPAAEWGGAQKLGDAFSSTQLPLTMPPIAVNRGYTPP